MVRRAHADTNVPTSSPLVSPELGPNYPTTPPFKGPVRSLQASVKQGSNGAELGSNLGVKSREYISNQLMSVGPRPADMINRYQTPDLHGTCPICEPMRYWNTLKSGQEKYWTILTEKLRFLSDMRDSCTCNCF